MPNRDNKEHVTDFDAARLVPIPIIMLENTTIKIEPHVDFILYTEHHAAENSCIKYILKNKIENIIVVEGSGVTSHNTKFMLNTIYKKYPDLPILMWKDIDYAGHHLYLDIA